MSGMEDDDEYERRRLANIAENEALLRSLEIGGGLTGQAGKAAPAKPKKKAAPKKAAPAKTRQQPERARRVSSRLAGIEADSEVHKRKFEEEAQELQKKASDAKRARHEPHTLAELLGSDATQGAVSALSNALSFASSSMEVASETANEKARAIANGDRGEEDESRRELRQVLDRMELRSSEKAVTKRVYCMAVHPRTDKDIVFVGDKEGSIGVWEPLAAPEESADDDEEPTLATGKAWDLAAHGRSPVTSIKVDPGETGAGAARTLYSASYDSTIRALDLEGGVSREVWEGESDVLLSIFDILPGSGPTSRNIWVADHRGGLISIDAREKKSSSSRWQVCEKKIGGMSVNKRNAHCIAVASLDQHVRLFDVRALKTLPTTDEAPYNAKGVDDELLQEVYEKAQIASHPARQACTSIDFSPRGNQLVGVSYDDVVKVWDVHPSWLSTRGVSSIASSSKEVKPKREPSIAKGRPPAANGRSRPASTTETDEAQPKKENGLMKWLSGTKSEDKDDVKPADAEEDEEEKQASTSRAVGKAKAIDEEDDEEEAPTRPDDILANPVRIPHSNNTGRWLTLFRAKWNENAEVEPHFTMGSMTRHAEIYAADGTLLLSLYDEDHVTAVPAVTASHPRRVGRLATGNASGRCHFWAPLE